MFDIKELITFFFWVGAANAVSFMLGFALCFVIMRYLWDRRY